MTTTRRAYRGGAKAGALVSPLTLSDITVSCDVLTDWPDGSDGEFAAVIGRGLPNEEKVLVDTRTGAILTLARRAYDGTAAATHSATETIEHVHTAIDDDEANEHSSNPFGHGIDNPDRIVGKDKIQTLTHKTIDGGLNTLLNIPLSASPETGTAIDDLETANTDQDDALAAEVTARTNADSARYTKTEADGRFEPLDSAYTKGESDARYAPAGTYLTQAAADARYARAFTDTGWLTSTTPPFAAQPGWTLDGARFRKITSGDFILADLYIAVTKTGSVLANNASGNVANTIAALAPPLWWPDQNANLVAPLTSGRVVVATFEAATGNIIIAAVGGSSDIAVGEQITLHGMYFVQPPAGP